ncbi:MAG: hypothetical protein OXG53_07240 [Chloroflexi bacterium]|nr:hypothetical protein [Chloroflexota bacterium]
MSEIAAPRALPVEAICAYCETQPIKRLSLLGPDFDAWLRPETDTGMLVEYLPDASVTYIDMARQERELSEILVSAVDLRTPNELEPTGRRQILAGATLVFAEVAGE